jgi:hypothetical protein
MERAFRRQSAVFLAVGLAIGLAIGGAMTAGVLIGKQSAVPDTALSELRLKAAASHGGETFAMATGLIDDGVEGLFCLDYLTGDLSCFVVNPRTGAPGGVFKTNVGADMGSGEKGKKPSYVMVTGIFQARGGNYGNTQIASSLVYVADANTGTVAIYGMPWSKQATVGGITQGGKLVKVYSGKVRSLDVRD